MAKKLQIPSRMKELTIPADLLTAAEAAAHLGVTQEWIRALKARGTLPAAATIAGRNLFRRADVERCRNLPRGWAGKRAKEATKK